MKWINNIQLAIKQGENALCPICGSKETGHGFTIIRNSTREGFGDVCCNRCKRGTHVSRMVVPEDANLCAAPSGIEYEIE